ncbi:hypothetical protein TVAG_196180 [Trichomonas vaginalis G3]|uniref:Uncharacterized protein n=1 Tax=Trichomonas vaginalis (strain ATCC PRA-98 / G3) TaxID=412133 RepID=A2F4V0_TRIV3|nr:hypothetical protein TVAGG3_0088560 [Trichomonas vaginalis G3]EAY00058.1 hypothetical protein TVAG_196180 [Trichomonas vaginalis G3]KAI5543748.1 hypothetical protein TVAGG3_0088560 [Trichomonas vaginalis G3]|eukprot:XP_001312987.1 hypothetical protein [Trichomonas vaginalis G3]
MFLIISIGYIFSNSYYYIFPAVFSILYGILFFSKPFITNELLSSSSYISALTLAATILCFSLISKYISQTSIITLNIGVAIPITFYFRWTVSRLKKKSRTLIRDQNFVELCKTPKDAALYYVYAAMQGCSNVYDCSHVESLQMKFGEDTYVSYFLCMSEMSLHKFPKNVVTKPSGFLKTDLIFVNYTKD